MKKLYIIGTGPGGLEHLSPAARHAIEESTDLVAYGLYIDLLGSLAGGKNHHAMNLGKEIDRARLALNLAAEGKATALLSSGDAGIYAMAPVVFELLEKEAKPEWQNIEISPIPGISAIQATAARAGAPLGHDFCTISLSDLLTPLETIMTRVDAAGRGDFVVAFYNPVSRKRTEQLPAARDILLKYRSEETPVILGRQITRKEESVTFTTLGRLNPKDVDMFTLVIVGNSDSRRIGDYIYTPRGYAKKISSQ